MGTPGVHPEDIAMAQTGFTPILIYSSSTTTNVPAAGSLTNSALGSELAINITDGKLFYKDNANAVQVIGWKVVPTTAGGTGLTTYTAGDMVYFATGTTFTKLAIGTTGQWLGSSGTAPQWNSPAALTKTDDTNVTLTLGGSASTALLNAASLTLGWTGQLSAARGGTGIGSYAVGDILYADTTSSLARLADVATGNALISGGVGVAPSWGKIGLTTHVSGTLPVGNGGTGLTSFTANGIAYASSTSALATGSALTFDGTNFSTTGTVTGTKLIPTGGAVTGNGMYLPATNAVAITTNGTQAIYINSSQQVGFGTTPSYRLHVTGTVYLDNTPGIGYNSSSNATLGIFGCNNDTAVNNGAVYNIEWKSNGDANGQYFYANYITRGGARTLGAYCTGTTWTNASDIANKENIVDLQYGLNTVLASRPIDFRWKNQRDKDNLGKKDIGFIAQEMEILIPEVVSGAEGSKGISYGNLVAVAFKAIQELNAKIEAQAIEIQALKATKGL